MYRFGPALEANRFEKLFYWPDPRGRALRQVRKGLDSQDPTLLSIETLAKKCCSSRFIGLGVHTLR